MVTPAAQPVTLEQLARLFEAANRANSELSAARFGVSKSLIGRVRRGEVWRTFSASPFAGLFA